MNGHIAFAKPVNCFQQIPYCSFTTNILLSKERSKPFDPKSVNDGETAPQYITRVKQNVRYRPHAALPWYTHTHIPKHASRGQNLRGVNFKKYSKLMSVYPALQLPKEVSRNGAC